MSKVRPQLPAAAMALLFCGPVVAWGEAAVELEAAGAEAWTGQRLRLFVEIRAPGTFAGATAFDLPEISRTVIMRVGSPTLGSETEGDTEYFTQRHEFALFSQATGEIELPPITVRFSHKDGYTGPTHDRREQTEPVTLTINRPPGSEDLGFLVTTDQLDIGETWDPRPGPVKTGAVFKRTVTQHATNLTGMALAPAPVGAPPGIRVYPADPEVTDKAERGSLDGTRRETLTYLVQEPGLHTLPEIRYDWWNPESERLESKTLPAVTFSATAPPPPPVKPSPLRFLWLPVPLALAGALVMLRKPLGRAAARLRAWVDPPRSRAARAFRAACRRNDAESAIRAWVTWLEFHPGFEPPPGLRGHLLGLYRSIYGAGANPAKWSGRALGDSFAKVRPTCEAAPAPGALPRLNPWAGAGPATRRSRW